MKASILINDSYLNKNGECMIYLRVFVDGKYLKIPLDISVSPDCFDKEKNVVLSGSKKSIYNHIIKKSLGTASDIIVRYQVNNRKLTKDIFIKEFKNPEVLADFYAFMEEQISLRPDITETSKKQHKTCLSKLKEFRATMMMSEIDENMVKGFEKHLRIKLKNGANTVHNNLKVMSTYINIAIRYELMTKNPFKYYMSKRSQTIPEFLSEEEFKALLSLYEMQTLPPNFQNVLRWFLFSCYTGVRISDIRRIKYENINKTTLRFKPLKTENINGKYVEIPLIPQSFKFMKDEFSDRIKGVLFECYADQVINRRLKDIAKAAEIEKDITFHTARHTFATRFLRSCTNANGIVLLKELLGHSDISTTMIYAHVIKEDIEKAMIDLSKL